LKTPAIQIVLNNNHNRYGQVIKKIVQNASTFVPEKVSLQSDILLVEQGDVFLPPPSAAKSNNA
jgi:hypothetical protein